MSYLSQPRLFFSGKFHADPATINNTPDNYNPNANFPPANGDEVGNNIQLYWNPNGSGKFAIDATITQVWDANGNPVADDPLLGQPLVSTGAQTLSGAKLVDLDPMQQNVTELWGLALEIQGSQPSPLGAFVPTAYSNAWVQVINGQGDYAGSAQYQSILQLTPQQIAASPLLQQLLGSSGETRLSVGFVLRAYNASSFNYLINETTRAQLNAAGVPKTVTDKLIPIQAYRQGPIGQSTPGKIPTTSYFEKLLQLYLTPDEYTQYRQIIETTTIQPYKPNTDFDFTWGQVFGCIGPYVPGEAAFFGADRMLAPASVSTDTANYGAYFAPFVVSSSGDYVIVNLGNALPSTQPASAQNSWVAQEALGQLQLCYFTGAISLDTAVMLGEIAYQPNQFYLNDAAIARISVPAEHQAAVNRLPLGIISTVSGASGPVQTILLQENGQGYYVRANQFVFRMNPGIATSPEQPRGKTQQVDIYVRQYGQPVANATLNINLMPSLEAANYTNNTLGTGGSSGLVNMSVPTTALSFPAQVTTNAQGIASFTLEASDPGNPRGYIDGQIYFLRYGFADPALASGYVQSPDDIISVQVYSQQPDFADITWENFVLPTLGLYGKLYPVMGFLDLQNQQSVIDNAENIYNYLNKEFANPALMPVTRDLSASRLTLLNRWLQQYFGPKKSAFAKTTQRASQ